MGDEATPTEYLDALIAATAEWMRVLKPGGSIFVNLGDKYAQNTERSRNGNGSRVAIDGFTGAKPLRGRTESLGCKDYGVPTKSLIGLPWRYALRCIDELGLILRAEIVWAKPNGLPESVTDRVRRSHEQVFHFVKQPKYYTAVDEVREEHIAQDHHRNVKQYQMTHAPGQPAVKMDRTLRNPLGKLPGSVWTIPTAPLKVPDHLGVDFFAAYPPELVRRIVLGWSPRGLCSDCGYLLGSSYDKGLLGVRRRDGGRTSAGAPEDVLLEDVFDPAYGTEQDDDEVPPADDAWLCGGLEPDAPDGAEVGLSDGAPAAHGGAPRPPAGLLRGGAPQERGQDGQPDREPGTAREGRTRQAAEARTKAVPVSALRRARADLRDLVPCPHCGSDRVGRSVVLDPFGGTGTSALVASAYGRVGISVDLSADYCRLAQWRTTDPNERARVLGVEKPPVQVDGQLVLFEGGAA